MNCKTALGLVSDYLGGRLAESAKQDFESHIGCCPGCASEVKAMNRLLASLSSLSAERSPVDCWDHVRTCILAEAHKRVPRWHWVLRPVVAAPAAMVMAVLVLFLLWPSHEAPVAPDSALAYEYAYYIGAHSHLQRQQAFADPDVVFVGAEVQKASLIASAE
jgi:anti-sigma factor RsiW